MASLHHSTKNSCRCLVGGLLASGHVKSPSASTSHESHSQVSPTIHSASSDKRWAIRAVAARLDRLWVVFRTFPDGFSARRAALSSLCERPKTAAGLADDNWGPWTNIGLADKQLETLLRSSRPSEPSAPSGLNTHDDA